MTIDAFWLALLVKIAATASVVVTASVVAERAGPFWGALIACLPVVAGPAYVLLALDADAAFLRTSALSGIAANAATGLFVLMLHWLAPRRSLVLALAGAIVIWLLAILALKATSPWSAMGGLLLNAIVYGAGVRFAAAGGVAVKPVRPAAWLELPLRALAVGLLVAGTVTASRAIGPSATGLAVAFPISLTSLAIVLHRRLGGAAVGQVMANGLKAMPGLALGLLLVAETVVPFGKVAGLIAGLVASCGWSAGLLTARHLARQRTIPGFR